MTNPEMLLTQIILVFLGKGTFYFHKYLGTYKTVGCKIDTL